MDWAHLRVDAGSAHKVALLFLSVFLFSLAYLAFALPSITFVPPTLQDNATTGSNWVYINLTSSESLNQSLLEWGNSTGFTNVSMSNSSSTNWYFNMTNLADGTYNYTIFAQNTTGDWNQTRRRFVVVDTVKPSVFFVSPTDENNSFVSRNYSFVNVSVNDSSYTTAVIVQQD